VMAHIPVSKIAPTKSSRQPRDYQSAFLFF
jgi:hypothetical protein